MASLRIGRFELEQYDLPPVCAKCGEKAAVAPNKRFSWSPSWLPVLILLGVLGLILYVILAASLTKRMNVPLPFCERHRKYWRNRGLVLYGGLVGWVLVSILAFVVAAVLYNPSGDDTYFGIAALAAGGLFLIYLITAVIVHSVGIRPNEITDRSITLVGLSREFVEEVREDRRGDDYEDERDRPRLSRRDEDRDSKRRWSPRGEDDDGGYYDPRDERRSRDRDEEEER